MDNNEFTQLQDINKKIERLRKAEENKIKDWGLKELQSLYNKMQQASQIDDFDTFCNEYVKYLQVKTIFQNL